MMKTYNKNYTKNIFRVTKKILNKKRGKFS